MIGTRDYRLEEAKKWGADYIFNTKDEKSPYYAKDLKAAIADVTHGLLAERAIEPDQLRMTRSSRRSTSPAAPRSSSTSACPTEGDVIQGAGRWRRTPPTRRFASPGWRPGSGRPTIAMIARKACSTWSRWSARPCRSPRPRTAIVDLRARKDDPIKVQMTP